MTVICGQPVTADHRHRFTVPAPRTRRGSPTQLETLIRDGTITDARTTSAYALLLLHERASSV